MRFGVCTAFENAGLLKQQGWNHLEVNIANSFNGRLSDEEWQGAAAFKGLPVPTPAGAVLMPGEQLKITGPNVDPAALEQYLERTFRRAGAVGCKTLVFGSGAARKIPDGFDREKAKGQILDFLRTAAPLAQKHGVVVVIEPLNRGETNVINSVAEGLEYVRAVNHPNVRQLVDSYHVWLEDETLEATREAGDLLKHVHLADKEGRVAPGLSGKADYRPLFRTLKKIGYDGLISVEAKIDLPTQGEQVLKYLNDEWEAA